MSIADKIAKLNELKASGAITEEEFQEEKRKLLSGSAVEKPSVNENGVETAWDAIPLHRKWWFQVALLLLLTPIGLVLTVFVPAYKKTKSGDPERIGKGFKAVCIVIALLLWGVNIARLIGPGGLPTCESSNAKETLTQAFDQSQMARNLNLSVVQVENTITLPGSNDKQRQCSADLMLNNGETIPVDFSMIGQGDGTFLLDFIMKQ